MAGSLFSNAVISFFVNTKQAEGAIGTLTEKFTGSAAKMMGALGGILGLKGLKGYYNELIKIIDISNKWNIPIEDMSRFMNMFSQFGGDAEEAVATVNQLQKLSKDLALHSEGAFRNLSAMIGQNLQNKDYKGAIAAFRNAFKGLNINGQNDLIEMIGADYPALMRMLRATDKEYDEAAKRAGKMRTITKDTADTLKDMDVRMAVIKQQWMNIASEAAKAFEPLIGVIERVTTFVEKLPSDVIQAGTLIITGLTALGAKFALTWLGKLLGFGGATAGAAGTPWLIKALGVGAFIDMTNGLYHGIKKAVDGAKELSEILAEMENHSYTLHFAAKLGGAIGEWLSNQWDKLKYSGAAKLFLFGSDVNGSLSDRGRTLAEAKTWLDQNKNDENYDQILKNYTIAENKYGEDLRKNARKAGVLDEPDWYNKQSKIDNRSVTINIYGVDGAEDMMSRLRGLPANNMSPISWKN